MRYLSGCVLVLTTLLATSVAAQVTQGYVYDANGRLLGVTTSGPSGINSATYTYDDANNRTARGQSGVSAYAAVHELPVNRLLQPYEALVSPDGVWSLALRPSGHLELWRGETPTGSETAGVFALTSAGEARFQSPVGFTSGEGTLELANDGALTLLDVGRQELWRSIPTRGGETSR